MTTLKRAADVCPGDLVDLAGDPFADRTELTAILFECELVAVAEVERETADCVCVHFESWDACGFPPDHMLKVEGHDPGYA